MVRKYSRKNYKDRQESPFNKGAGTRRVTGGSLKDQKGITLIALIITIIVMLILVAVTISMAVNGGLFEYAGKATGETQNAINDEQALANGKIKIGDVWYNSIDEFLKGSSSEEEKITFTVNGASYETVKGQTWESWISQGGSALGYEILRDGYVSLDGSVLCRQSFVDVNMVQSTDSIVNDGTYFTSSEN